MDAWKAHVQGLKDKLPNGEPELFYQAKKEWLCRDETQVGESYSENSPSGKYRLDVTHHDTGNRTWRYSKGRVYRVEGNVLIETVCRNYSSFATLWVEDHPNGHSYLVCGEDYQGQTVIELDTGKRVNYLEVGAKLGYGFCWQSFIASPSKNTLAAQGCYWACPYQIQMIDFSNPMGGTSEGLPILEVFDDLDFFEWNGPDSCQFAEEYSVYTKTGVREDNLLDSDWAEIELREKAGETEAEMFHTEKKLLETWVREF